MENKTFGSIYARKYRCYEYRYLNTDVESKRKKNELKRKI